MWGSYTSCRRSFPGLGWILGFRYGLGFRVWWLMRINGTSTRAIILWQCHVIASEIARGNIRSAWFRRGCHARDNL